MSADKLNQKQEAFCLEYCTNGGDGTAAYIKAYHPKNKRTAAACASRLLTDANILHRIRALHDAAATPQIASMMEAKATLSSIMRDPEAPPAARIRSAEALIRAAGGFMRVREDDGGFTITTAPRDTPTADGWDDVIIYDPRTGGPPEPPDDDGGTVIYLPIQDRLEDHEPDDSDDERETGG